MGGSMATRSSGGALNLSSTFECHPSRAQKKKMQGGEGGVMALEASQGHTEATEEQRNRRRESTRHFAHEAKVLERTCPESTFRDPLQPRLNRAQTEMPPHPPPSRRAPPASIPRGLPPGPGCLEPFWTPSTLPIPPTPPPGEKREKRKREKTKKTKKKKKKLPRRPRAAAGPSPRWGSGPRRAAGAGASWAGPGPSPDSPSPAPESAPQASQSSARAGA